MNPKIKEILEELYQLDDTLKQKENQLIEIIEKMMESKPSIEIDQEFKKELRIKIMTELNSSKEKWFNFSWIKYLMTFLSWVVVVSLVLVMYPNIILQEKVITDKQDKGLNLSFSTNIKKIDKNNAFWIPNFSNDRWWKSIWGWWNDNSLMWKTLDSNIKTTWVQQETIEPAIAPDPKIMPYPEYKPKQYIYNLKQWETLPQIPKEMYVYKDTWLKLDITNSNFKNVFSTDVIDISKINNLWLSGFNLYENQDFWYVFNFNINEWNISIYRNYEKWVMVNYETQKKLTVNDMPSDEKVLSIVKDFLNKYSIKIDTDKKAFVQNAWRKDYENTKNKSEYYFPDYFSVVFQQIIEWYWVYEEGWYPTWIMAWVNIRDMKVDNIWPIQKMSLEWSKYETITDSWIILDYVKKWQNYNVLMDNVVSSSEWNIWEWVSWSVWWNSWEKVENQIEEVQVEIWNAKIVYLKRYVYENESFKNKIYYVPAILFEVLTKQDPEKDIYPWEYITVPLVKDFMNTGNWIISPMVR